LSFLTKFFIVLHVVLTMLFVGATVVFVNRMEAFKDTGKDKDNKIASLTRQVSDANAAASMEHADALAVKTQAGVELGRMREQHTKDQADLRDRDVKYAAVQQEKASGEARLQAAVAALKTAQTTVDTLQKQLTDTRTASDKTQQQNTELLTANADLNNRLRTAVQQLRNTNEELDTARNELADARTRIPAGAAQPASSSEPAATTGTTTEIAINGVIRDQKTINGVKYATISVGSQDQVAKGMRFIVIDRTAGDFLGYLTVDRVEPNEASGRLDGPRVSDMKIGNEVRTQL
jgi:hypothetical protein